MHNQLHKSLLKTLTYSDLFDYPLTKEELWRYLLSEKKITYAGFEKALDELIKLKRLKKVDTFYCLFGREKLIRRRLERQQRSKHSLLQAQRIANILSYIPTIEGIGVSGSLAMENNEEDSDIDLFFISHTKTLWLTRLFVIISLQILGIRRKRNQKNRSGDICANMFVDASVLTLPQSKQNLYAAHEVVQVRPLINKHHIFERFWKANSWLLSYLPHALYDKKTASDTSFSKNRFWYLSPVEFLAHKFQLWYMQKHRTTELVESRIAAFHPCNYESIILSSFEKRIKKYA